MKMAPENKLYVAGLVLYMAFELSDKNWVLGFSNGQQNVRLRTVKAGDIEAVLREILLAKEKLKLPADCEVLSCYEAGWEGFWLARWLESVDIKNYVLESAAIEQNRRAKKVKTDKVDVKKLVNLLQRYDAGEKSAFRVVKVPSEAEEDGRQLHRERKTLVDDRGSHVVRVNSLLRSQGIHWEGKMRNLLEDLEKLKLWNGNPLAAGLKERLTREWHHWELLDKQVKALEKQQDQCLKEDGAYEVIARMMLLKSMGIQTAWVIEKEIFSWREIKNRRELASLVGLTPTPYSSGSDQREQGISKAGNKRVRTMLIEWAWMWLRYQKNSKLSLWYMERFGRGSKRQRRVGIVALARKLIIALWHYRDHGIIPEGAELKQA